jgi:hypothetical protein
MILSIYGIKIGRSTYCLDESNEDQRKLIDQIKTPAVTKGADTGKFSGT